MGVGWVWEGEEECIVGVWVGVMNGGGWREDRGRNGWGITGQLNGMGSGWRVRWVVDSSERLVGGRG